MRDLTQHLMARANDSHAPPVSIFTKFVTSMTDGARDMRMLLIAHEHVTCVLAMSAMHKTCRKESLVGSEPDKNLVLAVATK